MIKGKSIGLFCGVTGLVTGTYFGVLPILQNLNGHQLGIQSSILATVIGVSTAVVCASYYHFSKNT